MSHHIGREIRKLRVIRKLDTPALAKAVGVRCGYFESVEDGNKTCSARLALKLAMFFELTGLERDRFLALRENLPGLDGELVAAPSGSKRLPLVRYTCPEGCGAHDRHLAPGGSADGRERDGECVYYDLCTNRLLREHPAARTAHCPPKCSDRRYPDRDARITAHTRQAWPEGGA